MKTIVDNLAVEYKDEGQGPVLLMLHGWGNTMSYFDSLCRELHEFRIVRLDAPGFGGSESPQEPWTVERYARFVSVFCQKIGIEPMVILGHSFGGRITTKGVSHGILNPKKIILIASAGVAERSSARNALYTAVAKIGKVVFSPLPDAVYGRLRRTLYEHTGSDYLTTKSHVMQQTFLLMIRDDLSADAVGIDVPTLLIWGRGDQITPLKEAEKLHSLIKDSKLCVIKDAGHFVYRDQPGEVAKLITDFV